MRAIYALGCKGHGWRGPILLTALILFSMSWIGPSAHGKEEAFKRLSLRGLKEIDIGMEALTPEAEGDGLAREDLLSSVGSQLRKAGIRVIPGELPSATLKRPYLYINITLTKAKRLFFLPSSYSIYLGVSLYQNVLLQREPSQRIIAITWQEGSMGGCKARILKKHVREKLNELVDKFIADFFAENPA